MPQIGKCLNGEPGFGMCVNVCVYVWFFPVKAKRLLVVQKTRLVVVVYGD